MPPPLSDSSILTMLNDLTPSTTSSKPSSHSPLSTPDGSTSSATSRFKRHQLPEAISLANSHLSKCGFPSRLAALSDSTASVAHDALAAALGVLVALAESREAVVALRAADQKKTDAATAEREAALADLARLRRQLKAREADVTRGEARLREERAAAERERKRLVQDATEIKGRLAALTTREAALKYEMRRKEKEFGKLQQKVHSMLVNRNAVYPPEVNVEHAGIVSGRAKAHGQAGSGNGFDRETYFGTPAGYDTFVSDAYDERQAVLLDENVELRTVIREMHLELDGLIAEKCTPVKAMSPVEDGTPEQVESAGDSREGSSSADGTASLPGDHASSPREEASPPENEASAHGCEDSLPSGNTRVPGDDASPPRDDASPPGDDASPPGDDASPHKDSVSLPRDDASLPVDDDSLPVDDDSLPGDDGSLQFETPTIEQMELPVEHIREHLESALNDKIVLLQKALSQ